MHSRLVFFIKRDNNETRKCKEQARDLENLRSVDANLQPAVFPVLQTNYNNRYSSSPEAQTMSKEILKEVVQESRVANMAHVSTINLKRNRQIPNFIIMPVGSYATLKDLDVENAETKAKKTKSKPSKIESTLRERETYLKMRESILDMKEANLSCREKLLKIKEANLLKRESKLLAKGPKAPKDNKKTGENNANGKKKSTLKSILKCNMRPERPNLDAFIYTGENDGDKKYACQICGKKFKSPHYVSVHVKNSHNYQGRSQCENAITEKEDWNIENESVCSKSLNSNTEIDWQIQDENLDSNNVGVTMKNLLRHQMKIEFDDDVQGYTLREVSLSPKESYNIEITKEVKLEHM